MPVANFILLSSVFIYVIHSIFAANINDRSMLGKRDSELAAVIKDKEFVSHVFTALGRQYLYSTTLTRYLRDVSAYRRVERFLIECRKTKTKVITTANQNTGKFHNEPIKTQSQTT